MYGSNFDHSANSSLNRASVIESSEASFAAATSMTLICLRVALFALMLASLS